jgi:ATP-dependent DNA helicase RecQ
MIFSDKTLNDLVLMKPKDVAALRNIYGIGEKKISDFGQAILDAICNA